MKSVAARLSSPTVDELDRQVAHANKELGFAAAAPRKPFGFGCELSRRAFASIQSGECPDWKTSIEGES